jgi:O-antigen ligase
VEAYASRGGNAGALEPAISLAPHRVERRWDLAFLGVLAYLVIEYARIPTMFPWIRPFEVGKIAVGLSLLGLLLGGRPRSAKVSSLRGLDIALGLFLFASLASALGADSQTRAWSQIIATTEWIVIYYIISRTVENPWRMRVFILFFLLLNLKLAQFGVRSYFQDKLLGVSSQSIAKEGVGGGSAGFFSNQGDFGVAMCVVWGFAAPLLFSESRILRRIFVFICFGAFTGAVIVSSSRGAILAVVAVTGFSLVRKPKRIMSFVLVLFVVVAGLFLLPEANKKRLEAAFHPEADQTANMRLTLWKAGMQMFYQNPVFGVGPNNFSTEFDSHYDVSSTLSGKWAPHNILVQSLSELGAAGTLPLLALWILYFHLNAKTRRILETLSEDAVRRFEYRISLGLDLAMVAYLVSGSFLTVLYYPHLWILLGLCAGLHAACLKLTATGPIVQSEGLGGEVSNVAY